MTDDLRLLLDAGVDAATPAAFWQAVAGTLSVGLGGAKVTLRYRGLRESGSVEAGDAAGLGPEIEIESVDVDGRQVAATITGGPARRSTPDLRNSLAVALRLAVMVGRRASLERERRMGAFIVELSRWLFAAPNTELLLRYTVQSLVALIEAQGGYVALREETTARPRLRVVTAVGEAADLENREFDLNASTTGRVIRSGEAVMTPNASAEPDRARSPWRNAERAGSSLIAPLHTSRGVIGAIGVIRFRKESGSEAEPFTITDLHYFTAVAAHVAGGIELSQAVEATRAAANRASAMVNASPLPLALVDGEGRVQQLNEAGRVVFGLAPDGQPIGRSLEGLGLSSSELPLHAILAGRRDGTPWHGRVVVSQPGGDRRICDCTVTGLPGLGSPHLLVALYDRTDELRAQRELLAREKLATVGEIAGGVAHEVNNPLTAIRMEAELLGKTNTDPEVGAAATTIMREVDRAARIVRSLLRLARRADLTPVRLNMNELVRDVAEIRQRVLRSENIEVRIGLDPGSP
ncbi:MAG TPA: histidine kinase dimerization/phospho-acceptor domain-containing protein, partial [Gemmatimonadales bacterium]|nr:histidine kinase dimerization/phospho-acceptor domain-containing protein [Gemmatimonadales bacterium]